MNNWFHLTWLVFHVITFHTVMDKPEYYHDFFYSFTELIPCSKCKNHYNEKIKNPNESMNNNLLNLNIFNWMVDIHNDINKVNKKKIWTYLEANELYKNKIVTKQDIIDFFNFYISYNNRKNNNRMYLVKMIISMINILPENSNYNIYKDFLHNNPLNENNLEGWFVLFQNNIK